MKMKKYLFMLASVLACAAQSPAQEKAPLRLVQTVSLPGVARKWDHFGVDLKGHRLFVTSVAAPAIDVFDLQTNQHLRTLTEIKEAHNVLPMPELHQIYVVDGEASEIKILDYDSYKLIGRIELSIDADPIAYDSATKYLYV